MRKLDIQIDIAREYEGKDKEEFQQDLRRVLEKYFELNSIHIRKEIHTVEIDRLNLKPETTERDEWQDILEIERQPLVTEFGPTEEKKPEYPARPQTKPSYY
ncbi:hypothetical protein GCM10007416_11400 [Kroppenstedtia guangzhouensis]|jgi:hypothetical protein|uniref:Uncharacterized protein n=1 Tax=Kroppenstedtia guangzhouensis TaxID=1274356 RepID=A0ABQ1GAZ0_9BACL|nr:hypothetical protein [Kroppenstedtia guangzhouensis]GGA40156.1 hypothetical protein GCM10007416_11400 [Kroppenstedtia guangzhouensis]